MHAKGGIKSDLVAVSAQWWWGCSVADVAAGAGPSRSGLLGCEETKKGKKLDRPKGNLFSCFDLNLFLVSEIKGNDL